MKVEILIGYLFLCHTNVKVWGLDIDGDDVDLMLDGEELTVFTHDMWADIDQKGEFVWDGAAQCFFVKALKALRNGGTVDVLKLANEVYADLKEAGSKIAGKMSKSDA